MDYDIISNDIQESKTVLDNTKQTVVTINFSTKIIVNQPDVNGNYRDIIYYLYYKYNKDLMIARDSMEEEYNLVSYSLDSEKKISKQKDERDLNTEEISKNNYTSLVGIWKNEEGNYLNIKCDGTINETNKLGIIETSSNSEILTTGVAPIGGGPGGYGMMFLPIGVQDPNGNNSDLSRPRIITGQSIVENAPNSSYFYRIK